MADKSCASPTIIVPGIPRPSGSKRAFIVAGKARIAPDNPEQRNWQRMVIECAVEAWGKRPVILGPVHLKARFYFPRPKSHYRKNGELRPNAIHYCPTKPDLDKLLRAVGDALSGIVWRDDSQVVSVSASKLYTEGPPEAAIEVNLAI